MSLYDREAFQEQRELVVEHLSHRREKLETAQERMIFDAGYTAALQKLAQDKDELIYALKKHPDVASVFVVTWDDVKEMDNKNG
jgi:hypothetical protein